MNGILAYSILALGFLLLVGWLVREKLPRDPYEAETEAAMARGLFGASSLDMAYRIFDASDYRWLKDELCFPQAASLLARHRRQLAIKWLKALRSSFKELVRLPDSEGQKHAPFAGRANWQMLWLTLRFHFLLSYALIIVRVFGPYHRLVPSSGWLQPLRPAAPAGVQDAVDASRIS